MKTKRVTTQVDAIIGQNLKEIRTAKKISQNELAKAMGVSFQQIQKYEKATNRISASMILKMAEFFDVDLKAFFKDLI